MGPMTGRAAGYCAGYEVPGVANQAPGGGRGMAWRRGQGGRGYGRMMQGWTAPPVPAPYAPAPIAPPPVPVDERTALEQQMVALKAQLDYLSERLQVLEGGGEEQAEE